MTRATDTLASVWSRSSQEVVRHGIEDWTVSTHPTHHSDVGCTKEAYAIVLRSVHYVCARNVLVCHTSVPGARTTSRPNKARDDGDAADAEFSEWTLSLEIQAESIFVKHVDVGDVGERC